MPIMIYWKDNKSLVFRCYDVSVRKGNITTTLEKKSKLIIIMDVVVELDAEMS